ncbi:MAG: hypothetical protein QOE58_1156, partial [Actinomycetota bacterium]|nr:hypothetical protein [Actinomycetota bacterium]
MDFGVEDRDALAFGGQVIGVDVFATLDESVGSSPTQRR